VEKKEIFFSHTFSVEDCNEIGFHHSSVVQNKVYQLKGKSIAMQ